MDINKLNDDECFELGKEFGERMTIHQQRKLFEGIQEGFDNRRHAQQSGGDVILGPGRLLRPIIEMFGRMDIYGMKRASTEQQVQA